MHNSQANFDIILEQIKPFAQNMVNSLGNITRCGSLPKFSDLEVVALSLTAEALSIDRKNFLFNKLKEYKSDFPNLISRRQYNQRRKSLLHLSNTIRNNIAMKIDSAEDYFIIDSKPLPIGCNAHFPRSKMAKYDPEIAPDYGYCTSQKLHYFGYKST